MTPFWVLQKDKAAASAVVNGKELILENRYLRRVIDTETGRTVSIKDGDGEEALSASCREGSFSADGIFHELSGPCRIRIMDGNLTEKKFDYAPRPCNTHPFPYPAPGKTAELLYDPQNPLRQKQHREDCRHRHGRNGSAGTERDRTTAAVSRIGLHRKQRDGICDRNFHLPGREQGQRALRHGAGFRSSSR